MSNDFFLKINKSRNLISKKDQKKLLALAFFQIFISVFDLAAVSLTSIIGSLTVTGISSKNPIPSVANILSFLKINQFTFQTQVIILGLAITILLISKTLISAAITKFSIKFLEFKSAQISSELINLLFNQKLKFLQSESVQKLTFTVTNGVSALTVKILGNLLSLIADISLFIILTIGLFIVDSTLAFSSLIVFSFLAFFLYFRMNKIAQKLGEFQAIYEVSTSEKIFEGISTYREMHVRNTRQKYIDALSDTRFKLAKVQSDLGFMPLVGKYIVEMVIVISAVTVSAYQFGTKDAIHAVSSLAVFLTAGSRIAPAALRIQQSAIQIKSTLGLSASTFELIEKIAEKSSNDFLQEKANGSNFNPELVLKIENLSFKYPDTDSSLLKNLDIELSDGKILAIVGESGVGKSTLADIILGLHNPTSGSVRLFGMSPDVLHKHFPGRVAYVPQEVHIFEGDFKSNIALGFDSTKFTEAQYLTALTRANLRDLVSELPKGIYTNVGHRGARLSGGQKQRLGLARALITNPNLLILDEATSALDNSTESEITNSLRELKSEMSIIVIAHRLSTIRDADEIIYLEAGKIGARGTFEDISNMIPNFGVEFQR